MYDRAQEAREAYNPFFAAALDDGFTIVMCVRALCAGGARAVPADAAAAHPHRPGGARALPGGGGGGRGRGGRGGRGGGHAGRVGAAARGRGARGRRGAARAQGQPGAAPPQRAGRAQAREVRTTFSTSYQTSKILNLAF